MKLKSLIFGLSLGGGIAILPSICFIPIFIFIGSGEGDWIWINSIITTIAIGAIVGMMSAVIAENGILTGNRIMIINAIIIFIITFPIFVKESLWICNIRPFIIAIIVAIVTRIVYSMTKKRYIPTR
jgi:hypothetical protein